MMRRSPLAALPLALLLGCATTKGAAVESEGEGRARPVPPEVDPASVRLEGLVFDERDGFAYVDGRTGESLSYAEVEARAREAHFVLAGEQHDQAAHHRLQARLLDSLGGGARLAVGLEMVPWHLQRHLTAFSRGELDVDELFVALDWEETWGHDPDLYRDLFEVGHAHKSAFYAINAPRELARAVAKKGLGGLSEAERAVLPELDLDDAEHRAELESVFREHHPRTGSGDDFANFYAVQVLWDETMAQRAVEALDDGAERVLVLAGIGHVAGYRGIPQRILRRKPGARVLTVVPVELDDGESAEEAVRMAIARADGDILAVKRPREVLSL